MKKKSCKEKLKEYLLDHVGEVLTTQELQQASGFMVDYQRSLRAIRTEEGWKIDSDHDDSNLKHGEYRLRCKPDPNFKPQKREYSTKDRRAVFERDGYACQICGATPDDLDSKGRRVRLTVGHVRAKILNGSDEVGHLRTECSECNGGAQDKLIEPPSAKWLQGKVRRASRSDQETIYEMLKKKFNKGRLL